jgi:hypothetical protein
LAEDAFRILNAVCAQQVECVAATFGCCFSKAIKPGGGSDAKGIPAWQVGSEEECKQAARLCEFLVRIRRAALGAAASARTSARLRERQRQEMCQQHRVRLYASLGSRSHMYGLGCAREPKRFRESGMWSQGGGVHRESAGGDFPCANPTVSAIGTITLCRSSATKPPMPKAIQSVEW